MTVKYLKSFWYKDSVHQKLKLRYLLSDLVLMAFVVEKTRHNSFSCWLLPAQYQEYKNGLLINVKLILVLRAFDPSGLRQELRALGATILKKQRK